jgi:hypothetical protein
VRDRWRLPLKHVPRPKPLREGALGDWGRLKTIESMSAGGFAVSSYGPRSTRRDERRARSQRAGSQSFRREAGAIGDYPVLRPEFGHRFGESWRARRSDLPPQSMRPPSFS